MNYKNELISTKYKPSAISDFVFPIEFHNLLRALMDCGQLNLLYLVAAVLEKQVSSIYLLHIIIKVIPRVNGMKIFCIFHN